MSEAWNIRFGTAGTSDSFAAQGYKSSLDVPEYTAKMGLNAFEYQCGRGVRLGLDKAARMAALAAERDILFSVHAPYYISMSSLEEDKRLNSIQYLLQSAAVCRALGGRRIIFHSGSCGKQSREAALEKALDTMRRAVFQGKHRSGEKKNKRRNKFAAVGQQNFIGKTRKHKQAMRTAA